MANDLPDDISVLSADEQKRVRETARKQVLDEHNKKLFAAAVEAEKRQVRIELGLAEPDVAPVEEEMVWVDIKLPDSITPVGALITDGRCFYDGQRYHVRASVAMDLNSRMWLAWVQDARIDGRWIDKKSTKPQAINGSTGQQHGASIMPVGR